MGGDDQLYGLFNMDVIDGQNGVNMAVFTYHH